jgi:hypothetical protein
MGSKKQLPACPECDKLHAIAAKSQVCGEFLDWIKGQFFLAKSHEHSDECFVRDDGEDDGFRHCGLRIDELTASHESTESLLARFFNIDMVKVENEKRALLDAIRKGGE